MDQYDFGGLLIIIIVQYRIRPNLIPIIKALILDSNALTPEILNMRQLAPSEGDGVKSYYEGFPKIGGSLFWGPYN